MEEMQPQRQLGRGFVQLLGVVHRGNFKIARRRDNRSQFQACQRRVLVELRLLPRQVVARALAVRMAFARRAIVMRTAIHRVISIVMITIRSGDCRSSGFIAAFFMRVMPAATERCMNQQRAGNQAGKHTAHRRTLRINEPMGSDNHYSNRFSKQHNFDPNWGFGLRLSTLDFAILRG